MHGTSRYGHLKSCEFSSKFEILKSLVNFLLQRSYMDLNVDNFCKKEHIWTAQTTGFWWKVHNMDRADRQFLVEVHIWNSPTTYFGMKSQTYIAETKSQNPIPKPNPKPTLQTEWRTYIPQNIPKPIPQNLIPNPYPRPNRKSNPKPISQNPIPNLSPKPNLNSRMFLRSAPVPGFPVFR